MNEVIQGVSTEPQRVPCVGDIFSHPRSGKLFILTRRTRLSGQYAAYALEDGCRWGWAEGASVSDATAGLDHIGPCKITVERL